MNKELTSDETRDEILDGNWLPWIDAFFPIDLNDYHVWISQKTVETLESIL